MQVIPGSHAGHVDLGQKETSDRDLIQDHAIALPEGVVDESKAENVILGRGDVSFHDSYIVHGSQANHSSRRRAALTVRYVPASTRIQPRSDRRQYLVRGRASDNGNIYFEFDR
jgi:ectoine hydroxylase-related dioxygenase (phytanoyl-CoA dioxygenase family)